MRRNLSAMFIVMLFAFRATPALAQDVLFDIETSTGNDTLFVGVPGTINFTVDANGNDVLALTFAFEMVFSTGNVIGPLSEDYNVHRTLICIPCFPVQWFYYGNGNNPDSLLTGFIDFGGGPLWDSSGTVWYMDVTASGPGSVRFDTIFLPPANWLAAHGESAIALPLQYLFDGQAVEFVYLPGDVNSTGTINTADIIFLVNFIFKSGPEPFPLTLGDVNASCAINSADIIFLVNFVFKSGPAPLVGCE